ncbi:MAG: hypothetical protein H6579_07695 [Chitinophagales bacterium]|nr:hypothetical protein [Chitinophagales bacterium]
MKKITSLNFLIVCLSFFVLSCSKDDDKANSLSLNEVIGTYQITDTYVYTCPGENQERTLSYTYTVFITPNGSNDNVSLLANNINEINTSIYTGSISGNSFSVKNSGSCGLSGEKVNGSFEYTKSCFHRDVQDDATDACGGFIIQPIIPQNLVSNNVSIVKL